MAVLVEQPDELVGGFNRAWRDSQSPGRNVCRAARNYRQRRDMSAGQSTWAAKQAVNHVAYCAVAAVHDDKVDPILNRSLRDFAAVATVRGVLDGQLQPALERM